MGTNDILNAQADKDLIAESVIDIVKECVRFGVKNVFVFSVKVNTRRSSAFINAFFKTNVQRISFTLLITRT